MKIINKINLKFLFTSSFLVFSLYCLYTLGLSYDQVFHIENGERRLRYLFSLGLNDYYDILHLRYYPGLYDTVSALISSVFPRKFYYEGYNIINFFAGISGLFGLKKVVKFFFGNKISKYFFIITLFSPLYFGHLFINPKDSIIATANFWIIYYVIKYINNNNDISRKNTVIKIGFFLGLGVGVRIMFLGTLIPIIIFFLFEFFFKKENLKRISIKNFCLDFLTVFFIAYLLMIICWPNVHSNIFFKPFNLFYDSLLDISQGVQISYFIGKFYNTADTPWYYLLVNFFYKIPVYIIISLFFYFIFFKQINNFFLSNTNFFYFSNICLLLLVLPILISIFFKLKIHDGVRYFLYLIPLINIFPSIFFNFLFSDFSKLYKKFLIVFLSLFFLIFVYKFITITPYHYTYLNLFNDLTQKKNSFENDYWGTSLKMLLKKFSSKIDDQNYIRIANCGVNPNNVKFYLKENGIKNYNFVHLDDDFDYAILINRALTEINNNERLTCFSKFKGKKSFVSVKKGSIELSKIIKN